jgi:hypothetical protein
MISKEEAKKLFIEQFNSLDEKIDYKYVVHFVSELESTVFFVIHYIPSCDENVMAIETNTWSRMGLILEFNALNTEKEYTFPEIIEMVLKYETKIDLINKAKLCPEFTKIKS